MTAPSLWGVGAALALVLGVLVLLAHAVKRMGLRGRVRGGAGGIEVLSRAGLGPRQGVATIRVDGRTALVSWGDGGVRLLMELDEAPAEAEGEPDVPGASGSSG